MFPLKLITLTALNCLFAESAKILTVVPTPSISHQVVFRPLTQELARRGHEVTVITTDPAFPKGQAPENLIEIDLHEFSYKAWRDAIFTSKTSGNAADSYEQIRIMLRMLSKIFEMQMKTEDVKKVINNNTNHYDLLILESNVQAAIGLSHFFKVPVISMSTTAGFMDAYDIVGAPSRPWLLYPMALRQKLVNLSLWDKITELYSQYRIKCLFTSVTIYEDNDVVKRLFGPDMPSIAELKKNIGMLFFNVHPMWDFNRPMPPNGIYMGGLHQKPSEELPKVSHRIQASLKFLNTSSS